MGDAEIQHIEYVANGIIKVSETRIKKNQKLINKAAQNLGLRSTNVLQCIKLMRLLKENSPLPDARFQKLKNHYTTNLQFSSLISKALGIVGNSDTKKEAYKEKKDQTRSFIKQNPAISVSELSKDLSMQDSYICALLDKLAASEEGEDKKIVAKWRAYQNGGSNLVEKITKEPGATYNAIKSEITAKARRGQKTKDPGELFEQLIAYCKEYGDEELREILLAHKKAGGYWPKKS